MSKPRRLDQLLSSLGYCSRSEARAFLKSHEVLSGGQRLKQGSIKVEADSILIDGEPLDHPEGLFILMHKPAGYVCSHDGKEGPGIYDLLPDQWLRRNPRPETIGRLDKDTTGVLLLTDNGPINHRWTSPRHHVEKVYLVSLEETLESDLTSAFARGDLILDGEEKACRPAVYEKVDTHTARLTLVEGKYHQVKRMFSAFGYTVTALHRERFGDYTLEGLEPGAFRSLPMPNIDA